MKAILCSQYCQPDDLVLADVPDPVAGPGEVVVALRAAALNRRDVYVRKGVAPSPLPVIPGSDGAGVVRSIGSGVSGMCVCRQVETGIQPQHLHLQPSGCVDHPVTLLERASLRAVDRARGRRVDTSQYGTGSSASSSVISTAVAT